MPNSLSSLAQTMQRYAQNIQRNSVEIQKDVAMHVLAEVVDATPIDTGRAMSNWLVNSGDAASYSLPEAHDIGVRGSTRSANLQQTISDGDREIASHVGGELHITNNLRYIRDLNNGKSSQAPAHFVEAAALSAAKRGSTRSILASSPGGRVV